MQMYVLVYMYSKSAITYVQVCCEDSDNKCEFEPLMKKFKVISVFCLPFVNIFVLFATSTKNYI